MRSQDSSESQFKMLFYGSKAYEVHYLGAASERAKAEGIEMKFVEENLNKNTVRYAEGFNCICVFVNDTANEEVLLLLAKMNVKLVVSRCAVTSNIDLKTAKKLGIKVVKISVYSERSVAEYAVGSLLCLSRKLHIANNRTKLFNFSVNGFVGFDLHDRVVGIIGTGRVGKIAIKILKSFGCTILAYDVYEDKESSFELEFRYTNLEELLRRSDIIMLFCPLTEETYHLINANSIYKMRDGIIIINTSSGGLINTDALISGLLARKIQGAVLDAYENEKNYFDKSMEKNCISDTNLNRLLRMKNIILTPHLAILTEETMELIAQAILDNVIDFKMNNTLKNEVQE